MAMTALDGRRRMGRVEEIEIWREATTIFMGPKGGHGGCGALGLALALHRRGFAPKFMSITAACCSPGAPAPPSSRRSCAVVQARDLAEAKRLGIPIHYDRLTPDDLEAAAADGAVPIVLCSTRAHPWRQRAHWIVVTGFKGDACACQRSLGGA